MNAPNAVISRHMPVLDGIRGLAILAVLIFHSTILRPTAPLDRWTLLFGRSLWIGVDLFFVLSGFLITGILYDAKGKRYYFRNFYARRALRIFPLYFLVVAVAVFVLPLVSKRFPVLGSEQWWYWSYLSNYYIAENGLKHLVLAPTWSLAIEEQFYLVWPLLVFMLSRRALLGVCVLVAGVAVACRWWLLESGAHPTTIYVSTHTRMDALAIGGWVALAARGPLGISGVARLMWIPLIVCGGHSLYVFFEGDINRKNSAMIRYGYFSVALFFGSALAIALTRSQTSWLHGVLTSKSLLFFGKYSYGIYLFNRPFVDIFRDNWFRPNSVLRVHGSSTPGQLLCTLVIILVPTLLALVSWHAFEKHFLRLKRHFGEERTQPADATIPKTMIGVDGTALGETARRRLG